ncbi:response regulator [Caenimonas soli]|uniref:response regulator n=1 Tax=Caenimonas soli TaxID=2735555 RepID=UPI0015559299|nr:response regulator [Caenimonas soli]NPC55400.1 response regulator [Caenimonas soli]
MTDIAILVVEDNPDHRELTVLALRECCDPARIATASDGTDALDFLFGRGIHDGRDTRKQPRLVILDMKLTRLHGLDVLKAMRAHALTQSVPVVMLSSSTEKPELDSCYEAGANSVVRKSLDYDELRRKMRQVYDFWVTVNEANRNSRV